VELYTGDSCSGAHIEIAADGQCHDSMAGSDTYDSYTYAADPLTPTCDPGGSSSAQNLALTSPQLICCAP
jgi:hypothetical protein